VAIWTALLAWKQARTEKKREREAISTSFETKALDTGAANQTDRPDLADEKV
jgi:hypothetical protein